MESIGTPSLWIGFTVFVLALLALDLGVFHHKAHIVSAREVEREWEEEYQRLARRRGEYDDDDYEDRRYAGEGRYHKKRRWTEIFDIFD